MTKPKRVRQIYTSKNQYTPAGRRGRVLADELIETFRNSMRSEGFTLRQANLLLDDSTRSRGTTETI